jgi:hypothetical protein
MNLSQRRELAATELSQRSPQLQASTIVDSLSAGLTQLHDLLVNRIHSDVELEFGLDTMISPFSSATEVKQVLRAGLEFDIYASIVVNDEVLRGGYVDGAAEWFLDWLVRLRMDNYSESEVNQRIDSYRRQSIEDCRRAFVTNLQRAVPESLKTPLVLFRLVPLAVRIVAASAFGDASRTQQLRTEQKELLPAISDCHECHGRLLGNEEHCRCCGNPIWTFAWLRDV